MRTAYRLAPAISAILSSLRPVRWLAKERLNRDEIAAYRWTRVRPEDDRALTSCAAFERSRSLTYRVIEGADHALSKQTWQAAYTSLLVY